jgi:predicted Rossmann fold flavoprotein
VANTTPHQFDVIVIGAGAAGLMCALTAGQRHKKVLLLDHAEQVGSKILISGGGRCNFTNLDARPECYLSANPAFCISALKRYTAQDFITLVSKHNVAFHEKKLGQLFCDHSAREIVALLVAECEAAHVHIQCHAEVTAISKTTQFNVQTSKGDYCCASLVIATGGVSIPKMGATGFAYEIARQFDVPVTETRPALVPLTLSNHHADGTLMQSLSGVSIPALAQCGKQKFEENILFTHRGLSGPAILQISSFWREGQDIQLNLFPQLSLIKVLQQEKVQRPKTSLKTILSGLLPARFAEQWARRYADAPVIGQMRDGVLRQIAEDLHAWRIKPVGTEGYAKAEVTLGGIDTKALSSQTMMVKSVAGLYFIGEAVDVTGWLGGYNFQWAWSSGWCAGMAVE